MSSELLVSETSTFSIFTLCVDLIHKNEGPIATSMPYLASGRSDDDEKLLKPKLPLVFQADRSMTCAFQTSMD